MNQIPTTDDEAIARIRSCGYAHAMTEVMIGLFRCRRKLGDGTLEALKETLLWSLSDESLRAVGNADCMRVLAEREKMLARVGGAA